MSSPLWVHPSLCDLPFCLRRLDPSSPNFIEKWLGLPFRHYTSPPGSIEWTLTLPHPPPPVNPPTLPQDTKILAVREEDFRIGWAVADHSRYFLVIGEDSEGRSNPSVPNAIWARSEDLSRIPSERITTFLFSEDRLRRVFTGKRVTFVDPGYTKTERQIIESLVHVRPSLNEVTTPGDPRGWVYRSTKGDSLLRRNLHKGQRKLCLAEVDFLTEFYRRHPDLLDSGKLIKVLYVGAAPGIHIPYLSSLFPNVRWILVDPGKFELGKWGNNQQVKVHRAFFASGEDASEYEGKPLQTAETYTGKVDLLINDVRNIREEADYLSGGVEKYIHLDQADAIKWLQIVKPRYGASLKNRHPYDVSTARTIRGDVRMQVWAPQSSTETRNWVWVDEGESPETRYLEEVEVDVKRYEDWCAFYNYCLRSWVDFSRGSTASLSVPRGPKARCGACLDCAYEEKIWEAYVSLVGAGTPDKYAEGLTKVIRQPTVGDSSHPHGNDQGELVARRKEMYDRYASKVLEKRKKK